MQTTSASMAWLFLQENEQVQYLQKIARRAKNPSGPKWSHYLDMLYFPHVVRFSVAIEATIFRIERRAIEAQRLQSIFTFLSIFLYRSLLSTPRIGVFFSWCCLVHRRWSLRYIGGQMRELALADDWRYSAASGHSPKQHQVFFSSSKKFSNSW